MDEDTVKVAVAALLHDIGCMVDAGTLAAADESRTKCAGDAPGTYADRDTRPGHHHTAVAIDLMLEKGVFPSQLAQSRSGEESLVDLAAGWLGPRSPMQWIVAVADAVSNGWGGIQYREAHPPGAGPGPCGDGRLLPVLEHLMDEEACADADAGAAVCNHSWCYPLEEVTPRNIFPVSIGAALNPTDPDLERKALFERFLEAAAGVSHREESLPLWLEHFESLLMVFTSLIPAPSTGRGPADVALFDHLKVTSALATALYLYHRSNGALASESIEAIKSSGEAKFLLVAGDFYGIQSFIFSDSGQAGKNRSKILRGRSFAVSLFAELAADMLCRRIGIPTISVLLATAGKFLVVAPNTGAAREAVRSVEAALNGWLMKISYGELSMGMESLEASPADLTGGNFVKLWDGLALKMAERKFKKIDLERFGGAIEDYFEAFSDRFDPPLCPFCGKRPSAIHGKDDEIIGDAGASCRICRDHVFMGMNLVKKDWLAVTRKDASAMKGVSGRLEEPIFGEYQLLFPGDGDRLDPMARSGEILKYWNISIDPSGWISDDPKSRIPRGVTVRFINGAVPVCTKETLEDAGPAPGKRSGKRREELHDSANVGNPKTFDQIACTALSPTPDGQEYQGVEALGILKADVDHLGRLMACGLPPGRFTLARLATLSRQVDWYFTLYLPHLLKSTPEFNDIYTVFAGGDDLFLIGPWNRVIELAVTLRHTFEKYVCGNEEIRFSAGITLHKPHTPLDRLARRAEAALHQSKTAGRNRVTLFSETAEWDEFLELQEIKNTINGWRDSNFINSAMLFRLNELAAMAEEEERIRDLPEMHLDRMHCFKWRALFHYTADRNVGRDLKAESREERAERKKKMIGEFAQAFTWLETYRGRFKIALWDTIYNHRKGD